MAAHHAGRRRPCSSPACQGPVRSGLPDKSLLCSCVHPRKTRLQLLPPKPKELLSTCCKGCCCVCSR
jgi:hypothetical protein